MATTTRRDPYRGYNFRLECDGALLAAFAEASGLRSEGLPKSASVSLKRGVGRDPLIRRWRDLGAGAQPERRNMTVVLLNETGVPVSRWRIANAWVSKIEGPSFNATGNDVAIESIELTHEGVTLE